MFRANYNHSQKGLFESSEWMDPNIRVKLDKSWAPIFYEHVFCQIDEKPFAVLYSTTGKPNFPINILLSLEYIKDMKDCNDLELMDYFYFDYLVNYAVGIRTLGGMNLAERTIYNFRERVYTYCLENPGSEDLLFGQFIKLLQNFAKEAGLSLEEQRTDTTFLMSNIKKAGRMSLAYDVLFKAVKAIPTEQLTRELNEVLEPKFKTEILYRTSSRDKDSKLTLLLNLCQQALQILKDLDGKTVSDAVRVTERFLSEQSINGTDGKKVPKQKKEISSNSLQSAYDEDATFRRKGNEGYSGYVLEISETCGDKNDFQLITDYAVAANNVSDVEIFQSRLETIRENTGCTDMYLDGGFHSEDVDELAALNGIELHKTNMSGTEPIKKISLTEYEIDEETNTIHKCPAGQTPIRTKVTEKQTTAYFSHETCENCPIREQCHIKEQVKENVIRIDLKAVNTSRERKRMKENQPENTSKRAGIEGSNSAMKRKGLKKLKVRGKIKSTIACGIKVTVQNIKRFIKYIRGGYKTKKNTKLQQGIIVPILQ